MDLLGKMATFVRVVEGGSLSAAAKQLRVSSGAVSRQIALLEEDLGVTLLHRTTRSLAMTDSGRRYYERCLRVLREVDEAQAVVKTEKIAGPLRISIPVTFGVEAFAPLLPSLRKSYPDLVLDVRLEDRFVELLPEGIDLAIRVGRPPALTNEAIAVELVRYPRWLVAGPRYLRKRGTPATPEALSLHDALLPLTDAVDAWTLVDGTREVRVRPRVVLRCNLLHALRDLAIDGAGVALLPTWLVSNAVLSGALRHVLPAFGAAPTIVSAVYRRDHRGEDRMRAVIERVRLSVRGLVERAVPDN